MNELRNGPEIKVTSSCHGCKFLRTEHFYMEDGKSIGGVSSCYCKHTEVVSEGKDRWIGHHYALYTPKWCPFLTESNIEVVGELLREISFG